MEETNNNGQQMQGQNVFNQSAGGVPPPPKLEDQVGVRTMQSDLNSLQQNGFDSPQSTIVNAPTLGGVEQQSYSGVSQPQPVQNETVIPSYQPTQQPNQTQETSVDPALVYPAQSGAKKYIILALLVCGGIALGVGAFFLVRSLQSEPQINTPVVNVMTEQNAVVPPVVTPTTSTTTTTTTTTTDTIKPVFASLIVSPTKKVSLTINASTSQDVKSQIEKMLSNEKLVVGNTVDIALTDVNQKSIGAVSFFTILTPTLASTLTSSIEDTMSLWLYQDKLGGKKLGYIIPLAPGASVKNTVALIEKGGTELKNLFFGNVVMPQTITFKDGQIEGNPVRFLMVNSKIGQVLEMGAVTHGAKEYLVITTSYNQMSDFIRKIKPSVSATSTPVTTTTTSTPSTTVTQ